MAKTSKGPHSKCLSPKDKILGEEVRIGVVVVVDSEAAEVVAAEADVGAVEEIEAAAAAVRAEVGARPPATEPVIGDAQIPAAEIPTSHGERPATDVTRLNQRAPEKAVRLAAEAAAAGGAEVDLQVAVDEVDPAVAAAVAAGAVAGVVAAAVIVAGVIAVATGAATGVAAAAVTIVATRALCEETGKY